jgi:hypothetical protein
VQIHSFHYGATILVKNLDAALCTGLGAVAWGFIVARALIAPVCAMYLATLGKRALVRREMYGNLLLTIGGTIQQILENLQFAADERLIEPLWRMQVLVDRAIRATTDAEMDGFDDDLLKALGELRHLRDQLRTGHDEQTSASRLAGLSIPRAETVPESEREEPAEGAFPLPSARHHEQEDLKRHDRRSSS